MSQHLPAAIQPGSTHDLDPVHLVLWIVDDDIEKPAVVGPFEDCLSAFLDDVVGAECPVKEMDASGLNQRALGPLAGSVRWLKIYSVPPDANIIPEYCTRGVEIFVYGIKSWDQLTEFLSGSSTLTARLPLWPHLVFTDIYRGDRRVLTLREDVQKLPGYQLALDCDSRRIPCIALTSEKTAIENFDLWDGRDNVFPVPRERIGPTGKVFDILKHRLSEKLFKRLWIPEFKLTVEGSLDKDTLRYRVTFRHNRKPVSEVSNVTPLSYGFLYVWAYASNLARLKGWHQEIARWADSVCPAVSIPPSNKEGGKDAQVHVVMDDLFNPTFWRRGKTTIFFEEGGRNRPHSILSANIVDLPTPCQPKLPACWNNDRDLKTRLVASLREILPPDGLLWLTECCSG